MLKYFNLMKIFIFFLNLIINIRNIEKFVKCILYSDLIKYLMKVIVYIKCKCYVLEKKCKDIMNC